jgi:hypothetical protein
VLWRDAGGTAATALTRSKRGPAAVPATGTRGSGGDRASGSVVGSVVCATPKVAPTPKVTPAQVPPNKRPWAGYLGVLGQETVALPFPGGRRLQERAAGEVPPAFPGAAADAFEKPRVVPAQSDQHMAFGDDGGALRGESVKLRKVSVYARRLSFYLFLSVARIASPSFFPRPTFPCLPPASPCSHETRLSHRQRRPAPLRQPEM